MRELGTIGYHYFSVALALAPLNPLAPAVLLVNPHNLTVMAVEYFAVDVGQPRPEIFGQPFDGPMPGHGPDEPTHYDLHMWAIPNSAGMFAQFNPDVALCPPGSLPPGSSAPPATGDINLAYVMAAAALLGTLALGVGLRLA